MHDEIRQYWYGLADLARTMPLRTISRAADVLLDCYRRGGTVFVLGNGGSAATASHFACDLAKGTRPEGAPAFRVVPLTDNVPLMTAWANDTDYERVFAEQLAALVRPDDVVVAMSCSGNSRNVLAAVEVARRQGAISIAMTGEAGGRLRELAYLIISVPLSCVELVEDAHLAVCHSMCVALRKRLQSSSESPLEAAAPTLDKVPVEMAADLAG